MLFIDVRNPLLKKSYKHWHTLKAMNISLIIDLSATIVFLLFRILFEGFVIGLPWPVFDLYLMVRKVFIFSGVSAP